MNDPGLAVSITCGVLCMTLKRNAVGILMGVELVLNAANINFVAFARYSPSFKLEGQMFAIIVIVLAAAEAAVALAIFLNFYNARATVDVDQATELKG
jgi:NADH-quinone oxidoreductase subunit K